MFTSTCSRMTSQEVYKYTRSAAPSKSKWRLIDIIPINYMIYTHNFYTNGKPRISALNHMLPVKICPAIPKPWQVEHEINNKIVCQICQIFADFVLLNSI